MKRKFRKTLVKLFKDNLDYTYLGDYKHRSNNSNIEEELNEIDFDFILMYKHHLDLC